MALRFTNLRKPTTLDDLDATQRRQLEVCVRLYFGTRQPRDARLLDETGERGLCFVELWDVEEDGVPRYDAFLYNVDSGAVFARGTTEVVAERIQFYFDNARDAALKPALQSAHGEARAAMRAAEKKAGANKKANRAGAKNAKKTAARKTAKKAAEKKTAAKKAAAKKTAAKKKNVGRARAAR